jgi:hypothetical protein
MGFLLTLSEIYQPRLIKKRKLAMLFEATAGAFRVPTPSTGGLSYSDCLDLYARFTQEQAQKSLQQGNQLEIQSRLFQNACRIGRQLKADFKIKTAGDVMRMSAVVYSFLNIEFHGEPRGDIVIKRCFFSAYYSAEVCHLISYLDEGLLNGLSGGGKLTFSQRITEGQDCCRAHLDLSGRFI